MAKDYDVEALERRADALERSSINWWKPDEGDPDRIIGFLRSLDSKDGKFGPQIILRLESITDDQMWGRGCNKQLIDELNAKGAEPGDLVIVKYTGMQEGKSGQKYHTYVIDVVEKGDGTKVTSTADDGFKDDVPF